MQVLTNMFLSLFLAHLLTDFVFQTDRLVRQKGQRLKRAYVEHGLTHYFLVCAIVAAFHVSWLASFRFHLVIAGLTGVHLALDWGKLSFTQAKNLQDTVWAFLLDQLVHLLTIGVATGLIIQSPGNAYTSLLGVARAYEFNILLVLVVYAVVIFGGGYLVRYATKPLLGDGALIPDEPADQLKNAGMYIGWLERFLILTALLLGSPTAIGLIIAAKTIARYPEFKSSKFAEYFLIGTLLSIGIAILGGIVLMKVH